MINDDLMESNDRRNSEIMDLEAPLKMGDGCPFLIKFYGAMHAEVRLHIIDYFPQNIQIFFLTSSRIFGF